MSEFIAGFIPRSGHLQGNNASWYNALMIFFGLVALSGVTAGVHSLIVGHEHVFGVTREVPWGILISTYVYFVVTATGFCIVSSLGHIFGFKEFAPLAKRAVYLSIISIFSGFIVIGFEIESAWRMPIGNVLGANLSSNIWWMGTFYTIYLILEILSFILMQREIHKPAVVIGFLALIADLAAISNLGAVFGLTYGKDLWHGPYIPICFIVSGAMAGGFAVLFSTYLAYKANGWELTKPIRQSLAATRRLTIFFVSTVIFFTVWKLITFITGNPRGDFEIVHLLLNGEYAGFFWIGEILLCLVIPMVLLIVSKGTNLPLIFIAAVSGLIGTYFMRYDLVIVGQLMPHYSGMGLVDYPQHFTYTPTLHELIITAGGFGLWGFLFMLGEKVFKGHETTH